MNNYKLDEMFNLINSQIHYKRKQIANNNNSIIRSHYIDQYYILKNKLQDIIFQTQYYKFTSQNSNIIDLHGHTRTFIDHYLINIIQYKKNIHKFKCLYIITGRGTFILYKYINTFLTYHSIPFTIQNHSYIIDLTNLYIPLY